MARYRAARAREGWLRNRRGALPSIGDYFGTGAFGLSLGAL